MIRWLRRPHGMSCEQVAAILQHYLDDEVEGGVARTVTVHLESCEHCAVEYTVYHDIKSVLALRVEQPLDPGTLAALHRYCEALRHPDVGGDLEG